ncbi:excinuclease ABC subunit C [Polymorphobacter multimanifer]|nr:GIY-YIG nuclease family protein [Polymorphobacter multimanifer]GGI85096.1 excinuclease ABC subunit C [Polymorphobacter multimanifer]
MGQGGWVYIMTNKPRGVLYVGVTADLARRVGEHRAGTGSAFCRRWGLRRLVWAERLESIEAAIAFEKRVKRWGRAAKIEMVERGNLGWEEILPW